MVNERPCKPATLRQATSADLESLVDFNKAMAKETEGVDLAQHALQAGVAAVLANHAKGAYHVAELDGKVIAALLITYEWSDWRNSQLWWIQSVYVHPNHRRQGYFKALYQYIRKAAADREAGGLRLYADMSNTQAHSTYEALGMTSHYKVFEDMF